MGTQVAVLAFLLVGLWEKQGSSKQQAPYGGHFLSPLAEHLEEQLEKMLMARGTARDEAQKLHRKWLKHRAFMVELACNKEWLAKIELVSRGGVGGGTGGTG